MTIYRMAFRIGSQGTSVWEECRQAGVAAIGYHAMLDIDLSTIGLYDRDSMSKHMRARWDQIASAPKSSLRRLCEMKAGDIIYVREGTRIVGRGKVIGGYEFVPDSQIATRARDSFTWQHQVPVEWDPNFQPIDLELGAWQTTILRLNEDRVRILNNAIRESGQHVW